MFSKVHAFSRLFKLRAPAIIQAPMAGGVTTPELVAAVSNQEGIGSFATGYLSTEQVVAGISAIKKLTSRPFAVNLFIPNVPTVNPHHIKHYQHSLNHFRRKLNIREEEDTPKLPHDNFREVIDVLLQEKIKIVSFTFGNLSPDVIQLFKKNDTYLMGTATSIKEAKTLAASGIDAIVVQGSEAGGHRGSFFTPFKQASVGTMALVPQIVDAIDQPVIAAGGIMDGRGILAAMALGASGVQIGTAFLCTKESGASRPYKDELIHASKENFDSTVLTSAYSGKMARGINTEFIEYMEANVSSMPSYPIPNVLTSPLRKEAAKNNATNMMSLWAGQGLPLITNNLSVEALLNKLRQGTLDSLEECASLQKKF